MDVKELLLKDGATLIGTYKNIINKTPITFICKCCSTYTKQAHLICKTTGGFCKDCSDRNTQIKRLQNKIELNKRLLKLNQ